MKVLKTVLIVLASIAAIVVIVGLFLPSEFKVERSKVIEAPQGDLFAQVNDVKNWNNWNAWNKMDPNWKVTYSENTAGEGAFYSWVSEDENVGEGKVSIIKAEPQTLVEGTMEFAGMKPARIYHKFESQDDGKVKVTFGIDSDIGNNIIMKYLFNLWGEKMVGGNYEKSLDELEKYVKENPAPKEEVNTGEFNATLENDSTVKQDNTEVETSDMLAQ